MNSLRKFIVTGFGTGYIPFAPGTWGSAVSCAVFLAVAWASAGDVWPVAAAMIALTVLASVACVALGRFGESLFGVKDPHQCTIDEVAGQALALLFVPLGSGWRGWLIAAGVSFFFFRLFDILKPPPARQMEKYPYGWGILLDDLMASVYANIASQVIIRLVILA